MSNLTDFFPSGGGGLTPKFEEFIASGTFTPTQALIDAGGYIEVFLVAGGCGGDTDSSNPRFGGQGGEAQIVKMYLTSVNACTVTIGGGGAKNTSSGGAGGNSFFGGAASGGIDVTSVGGYGGAGNPTAMSLRPMASPSWPSYTQSSGTHIPAGPGINGYGGGGGFAQSGGGGSTGSGGSVKPNTGQGGIGGGDSNNSTSGGSGYCLIKWYE